MKKGFTLIELMVVIGIIAVLSGSMVISVNNARQRARVARASQEVREMTNAILAFEQYAKNRSLQEYVTGGTWTKCSEGSLSMILGGATGESGEPVPVLYSAHITGTELRDPWGTQYEFMIDKTDQLGDGTGSFLSASALPNYWRLTDKERGQ